LKNNTDLGKFGTYGGRYVPETLIPALEDLDKWYQRLKVDKSFQRESWNRERTVLSGKAND